MRVYFDKSIVENVERIPFLNPILGNYEGKKPDNTGFYSQDQKLQWTDIGKELLNFSNVEDCDYIVFPIDFKIDYISLLEKQTKLGQKYGKKVIVFYYNDCELPIPNLCDNMIVFRTSMNDLNPDNEFFMPGFPNDLGKEYGIGGKLNLDEISTGYVGYGGYYSIGSYIMYLLAEIKFFLIEKTPLGKLIYKILINKSRKGGFLKKKLGDFLGKKGIIKNPEIVGNSFLYLFYCFNKGKICRSKIIKHIEGSGLEFHFIERSKLLTPGEDNKKDYVNTIKNCTFPLATRGDGNYSYRLYEIMSLGKIPLFIDTQCRLPFDNEIDYKNMFVWVPFNDAQNIKKYINQYLSKNRNNINDIQRQIRLIYENYFTISSYYTKIINQLMDRK